MEGIPKHIDYHQINKSLLSLPNIINIHDVHIWSLDGETNYFTGHVVANSIALSDIKKTKKAIKTELNKYKISHSTIELESDDDCSGIDCQKNNY